MVDFKNIEEHPNPQFYRKDFYLLDGKWMFGFDKDNKGLIEGWQRLAELPLEINVPYVYQSEKSGINSSELCETVWYKRFFELSDNFKEKRIIIHFLAVDYECDVWINSKHSTHHLGGYSGFCADITELLIAGKNEITVRVNDRDFAKHQMRGKQLWGKGEFGCWYKRYTGIWQSVWLEAVDSIHINKFIIRTDIDTNSVILKADIAENGSDNNNLYADIKINLGENEIADASFKIRNGTIDEQISVDYIDSPFRGCEWWSPEHPTLYQMSIAVKKDNEILDYVQTYFGIKKTEASNGKVLLNNFPFYHRSLLYQGYYPEGYITPENDERIISDIKIIKSLGYNSIRIHEKIESPKFLYWCDKLGLAVFEEMPSMYKFSELEIHNIISEITSIVERDINHPAITTWVMFNESWGVQQIRFNKQQQNLVNGAYYTVKSMDPTRFVIGNDGWQQTETDLVTIHDYSAYGDEIANRYNAPKYEIGEVPVAGQRRYAFAEGYSYKGQPVMMTEYGGISYAYDGGWGYNDKVNNEDEFIERFASLTKAIKSVPNFVGFCFTQFTDVENEQNGLVTINREPKVSIEIIRKINLS